MIDSCNGQRMCFREAVDLRSLSCYINSYRPITNITLSVMTAFGNLKLSEILLSVLKNGLYTTTVTLSLPISNASTYTAVSCEALEPPYLLDSTTSMILLQNEDIHLPYSIQEEVFVERHRKAKLTCAGQSLVYVVWMKKTIDGAFKNLAEAITVNPYFKNTVSQKYILDDVEMSLQLDDVDVNDEGHYICVSGDGINEYVKTFDLNVYSKFLNGKIC